MASSSQNIDELSDLCRAVERDSQVSGKACIDQSSFTTMNEQIKHYEEKRIQAENKLAALTRDQEALDAKKAKLANDPTLELFAKGREAYRQSMIESAVCFLVGVGEAETLRMQCPAFEAVLGNLLDRTNRSAQDKKDKDTAEMYQKAVEDARVQIVALQEKLTSLESENRDALSAKADAVDAARRELESLQDDLSKLKKENIELVDKVADLESKVEEAKIVKRGKDLRISELAYGKQRAEMREAEFEKHKLALEKEKDEFKELAEGKF